jgi:hypothetical protein
MNDCQRRQIEAMRKAGDGLQGHRQEDQAVTGQRTELLQVASPAGTEYGHHLRGGGRGFRKETCMKTSDMEWKDAAHRPAEACGI